MPEEKDKIKKLYDTFVSDGYDMESEEDFRKDLLDSTKRKAAYDALVKDGYDMEPFEEFESNIGFGKERTSSQQSGNSASGTVEEPISPANEQTWQPTEKEKVAMLTETDRIMNDVKSHTQTFNERIDNMQEYGINPGLQTKEGKMIFNPESGKLEKTFLTPAGNRYYSKSLADMESFQYRQAADMSIGGQLRKANLRLQELKAKQEERASEVHKEWAEETENNKAPLAAILGAATYTPRQQSDKENRALSVAIRETEELIKNLEEQKDRENGVDVGFWRGFGRTMGDVRTWDFGMGDMRDAFTMMNADELKKENATEGEREAHDAMMGAIHEKQQAEERYSGNADFWNRAGVMTGYMPSFMLDFVLTGGGFNGLSSFSKGSTRLATKVISKETAEKMAQQGFKSYIKENGAKGLGRYATDWTIKALGTTADDLLVRAPLMANTVQAGKTTADIIDRKLGDVVVDENGNYDFSNDKTWGDAIWQSEANAIIENYSEMFGAHLDPVFTLGNMSKLAKVVGAKRIGTVLSKADASALNGIMGQTHQMFNKMGMSDYVGEVSEEYYGQLWRTMLNLDDAYQQNPDGTRTNLFASGQFHGDIWGGMALSMGLMGAGKHTLSAANYTSMKHGVNKADAKVNELLGKEVWEPLKETLDLTTNENIGEVAELIAGDKDFTINEKAAVLDYMERSLNLRGFNLASMAQSRGGNRNESVQQANDSYLDGYNIISSQEMNDAKNMYEYQRARVADLVDESMFAMIEENPIAALEFVNGNEQWNDEDKVSVIDYINAKQVYNGMIQRVRDDIDGRIEQSNSMIDARVNRNTGMIQGATMKQDERKVYVISGKLVPYDDGSGVSVTDSDNSIIIRDSETGALEQVSPDAVLSLDESQDPNEQKELAEQAIVEQFAREAADKIDGKVTFNPGDAYTITGQDGSQMQVQIIANEDGIVDNGDGTVNVSDGVNIFPLAKETIQQQADAANLARVAQFEQQRTIENAERKQEMQEAERPQYALNDIVSLTDENGVTVRGNITADADADGKYEVFTEAPINGKRVNLFTRDELDNMLLEHNGVAFERPVENESNNGAENIPENDNNAPQNIPAMQRIPKDEQGNPLYEQADSDTAWDAIVEQTEGDEDMAQTVVDGMVADKEEALKKLEKAKSKGGNSIAEKIASEKERKAAIDAAKQELLVWQKIAGTAKRRKMEADDERRRIADEAAALRKAEEEKLRAEREEAERIERFGVEDSLDVTAYQRLKTKGAIADSIMNGKQMMNNSMTNRVLEEEEDVFGDTVAQLSGSEYAMLKNNAEKNVRKYASRKKQWETDQTYIHNAKPRLKAFIKDAEKRIEDNGRCLEAVRSSFPDGQFKEIVTGKHRFTSVDTMDDFFKEHNKSVLAEMKQMKDGEISGEQKRELIIQIGDFSFVVTTKLTRKTMSDGATLFNDVERRMTYSCLELGIEDVPVRQNLLRNAVEDITDNVITGKDFAERLSAGERSKKHNEAELKELLSREGKPFEYEEELAQAKAQLEEYAELMKKELEEKEAKYAEMDASVETANNISASEEDDELKREGGGAYTDDEVSYENDPVAKLLGQSRRTAKQRREFAQRERQRMAERVEILAEKLHLDNVEIVTDASVLDGKKQRAKGFYSKSTGKITIVIPNHTSAFDVEQTLLHEAVAHYGLRQLFGEHFDTFLDNVFNNADENIRKRIVDMAAKNGWNFRKATEEYLASLAEQTEFENINASWWRQIKDFFLNMLHKIGFDDFRGVTLTDNELRYILWRSYENLAEPGRYRSILGEAADVAKQYELGVGNYSDTNRNPNFAADSNDELYRDGSPEMHERELARDRYERRVKTGMFQSQEALQDSMLGLKEAMQAILGQGTNIEDVDGFENAYLGENRLSSVNKAEADAFAHTLFKPMLDEVAKLARTEAEREELTDYMMAKHGLERNTYMRNEAINNGATNADQTDYAGLTALTGMDNVTDAETEAQIMVNDYEQAHDTADLWKKVNAVSKAILSKSYECGMMSKATFDKISDMYDFYIPLRGFDEKTSTEAYAYLTHKQSAFNAPIKKAEGRRSKADDPFANLQSMAEGAIMQGNRNKLVKQRFLNFALNHPSDLVSVSDIWVEYDTVTNEWKPVFPDNIDSTDTPEEVERKMLDFETKMKSLAQQYPDRYKHGKDTVNIPYRIVESRDMRQHQIIVKRGGRDYVITINGNPRAAQALNGQTNPDNDMSGAIGAILRAGENINRQLSAFYTTRNPDFIVSNFMRDMLYTNTMTWIRESPNYALRFHRNYMYANPVRIKQLLAKHRKGTLDMGNKTEAMFHQFMMNGGETGYANIRDIEQHKNDIRRELKKSSGKIPVKKAWDLLGERFDEYNRAVENCARFAAFMTSREMGRSIDRSIYDAKEISVNFNKKGSGAKFYDSTGQTKAGNASALVSGLGRSGYVFWNAAIQGTTNFGRQVKRHPAKSFTGIAAMFLLGAIVAYLGGDDDDDDDKNAYYNLPEYVRRSNILFRAGNSWVSIPLPVEYRAVYGMGELMISILNGKEHLTGGEIAESITGQVTQILPIDLLEGGGGLNAFVPSAYKPLWEAYVAEKSWTGMPLYKDTPWNKDMPEWTKAYKSANKYIVGLANVMNEATGGDSYTKGAIDFNPAKIEYMLNGYFGGVFGTIDKLSKTVETVTGNREYDPRSFLLANRLVKAGDERTEYRAVNNEYFRLKEEHDRLKSRLKHYEEDTDNDIFDYAEKIDFLYNSPEYERYEIFEDYRRDIDDLYNELNDTVDDEERKNIEAELNELKKEMIEEMNKTRK